MLNRECKKILMLSLVVVLSGCETVPTQPDVAKDPNKLVAQRAIERWQALIKGDLDQAYTYLSAGSRQAQSIDIYKAKIKPGLWRAVDVKSSECDKELCKVQLELTYDYKDFKGIKTPINESWIIENNNVWYVLKQ